jgi:uncharacterized protein YaeQ
MPVSEKICCSIVFTSTVGKNMAIGATVNKVSLNVADTGRHHYQQYEFKAAQHPSENDFRFVIRMIAFALNASESLVFNKGLSTDDEPELWRKSLSDEIELWVDFGQLDEKRIRKACARSSQVVIYTYHERKASVWWLSIRPKLSRFDNLSVFHIDAEGAEALIGRNMQLQCSIDDGQVYLSDQTTTVSASVVERIITD